MKEGRERETFQSQRVHLREEGTTENTRERERALFCPICFPLPPRGTKAEQNFRRIKCAGGKKEVKSEILFLSSKTAHHLLALMLCPLRAMR